MKKIALKKTLIYSIWQKIRIDFDALFIFLKFSENGKVTIFHV